MSDKNSNVPEITGDCSFLCPMRIIRAKAPSAIEHACACAFARCSSDLQKPSRFIRSANRIGTRNAVAREERELATQRDLNDENRKNEERKLARHGKEPRCCSPDRKRPVSERNSPPASSEDRPSSAFLLALLSETRIWSALIFLGHDAFPPTKRGIENVNVAPRT